MRSDALTRVLECASAANTSIRAVLAAIGLENPRMSDLRERLGLDKSIASRLTRAMRASSAEAALRELPGTEALLKIMTRCAELGAPRGAIADAESAIGVLARAIGDFPGDRTALKTAIEGAAAAAASAESGARVSEAKLRASRRGAYNAFLFAQGIVCEMQAMVLILGPGSTPRTAHQAMVFCTTGLRRLRPGTPMSLLRLEGGVPKSRRYDRTSLSGEPLGTDPRVALLPEFSSSEAFDLHVESIGNLHGLMVDAHNPPLDRPMQVTYGVVNRDFTTARQSETERWAATGFTPSRSTRSFVCEVFLHSAHLGACEPMFCSTISRLAPTPSAEEGPRLDGPGIIDQGAQFEPKGTGLARRGGAGDSALRPILRRSFELLGWNAGDFQRYHLEVEFPLPLVDLSIWLKLAPPDRTAS